MPGVLAIKTERRCKICTSPNRAEVDDLLLLRSLKTRDPVTGELTHTLEIVLAKMAELGIANPTEDNIKAHWRKHCQVVSDAEVDEVAASMNELSEQMLAALDESDGSVDGDLLAIWKLGLHRIRGRIMRGEDPGITTDQMMKAAQELSRRQHSEHQRELLMAIGGGIALALSGRRPAGEIESGDVVDHDGPVAELEEAAA